MRSLLTPHADLVGPATKAAFKAIQFRYKIRVVLGTKVLWTREVLFTSKEIGSCVSELTRDFPNAIVEVIRLPS